MDLTTLAATITALGVIFGAIFAAYKWFLKQEKQDKDIKSIKGLKEQGCNGPVTDAINQIEKHINKLAHK